MFFQIELRNTKLLSLCLNERYVANTTSEANNFTIKSVTVYWIELVTVLSGKEYYFEYPNGDKMCTVIVLFKVLNYTGEVKVSDNESKKLEFFSLNNLPNMESRAKAIVDKILAGSIKI